MRNLLVAAGGGTAALMLIAALSQAAPSKEASPKVPFKAAEHPRLYYLDHTPAGEKIIYTIKNGVVDRRNPLITRKPGWQSHDPVPQEIICYSYHGTGANGEICGMKCDDNTTYGMSCGADIFDGNFDIEFTY